MNKPALDFFLIGAAKCGTSSLYRALRAHPDVFVSPVKEPHFFYGKNDAKDWDWYASLFEGQPTGTITGDFSPTNSVSPAGMNIAAKIHASYPDAKIIYIVRNPIDCAISAYRMEAPNRPPTDFADAMSTWSTIFDRVQYWRQLSDYRAVYPDSQIKVLVLEDMKRRPARIRDLYRFLGIRDKGSDLPMMPHANRTKHRVGRPPKPEVAAPDRQRFYEHVAEDAAAILNYIGLPASYWKITALSRKWD